MCKLFVLDRNTWNNTSECKLFVLKIISLQKIIIIYLKLAKNEKTDLIVLFYGISTLFGSINAELNNFDKRFKQFSLV